MLGRIESFRRDIGVGIIRCEDGRKVRFHRDSIINQRFEIQGEDVDFLLDGRTPTAIVVLAGSPWSVFAGPMREFPAPDPLAMPASQLALAA